MVPFDWPAIVRGLQLFCLVTWAFPVFDKGGCVWRMLRRRPERWDAPWAAFWMLAVTQMGFSLRWLAWPSAIEEMPSSELRYWSVLYVSSALTAMGMVYTQGLTAGGKRNRRALVAHMGVLACCILAVAVV